MRLGNAIFPLMALPIELLQLRGSFQSGKHGPKNSKNHAKGFNVKRGMLHALGKYILFSDEL